MNALQRTVQQIAAHPRGAAFFRVTRIDVQDRMAYRLSGRRATITGLFAAFPTVLVTTTGRRTGRPHTVPLVAVSDPERPETLGLIASNFGQGHDPDWCLNLRALPEATILGETGARRYRAREVEGGVLERWFALGSEIYVGYRGYRRRAGRPIPVFELVPPAD